MLDSSWFESLRSGSRPSGRFQLTFSRSADHQTGPGMRAEPRGCRRIPDDLVRKKRGLAGTQRVARAHDHDGTFVAEMLNACGTSSSMPLSGGEGAPGAPSSYPPGGF